MAVNVVMPQMGESVAEGTVVRWIKKPGDRVERDEPLLEISTDKVDAEIPSPAAGVLTKILVKENQTVEVNTIIAEIDTANGARASASAKETKPRAEIGPKPPARMVASPIAPHATPPIAQEQKARTSPLVRKIAQEHRVDLSQVPGTGLGGRVSKKDIMLYLESAKREPAFEVPKPRPVVAMPAAQPESASAHVPVPSEAAPPVTPAVASAAVAFRGPTQSIPMTPMRRQIAEHMVMSRRTSAHVATVFEVEMSRVAEQLASQGAEFERRNGVKLTYTPFIIRAAVEALKQVPVVNASIDGESVIYKRDVNIGVAVALETGLIVPVIKHADEKSFLGVARSLAELAERARSKRLSVDDVLDGTFTISNHGVTGSLIGTPIISQPQVAILGVGKIEKRPVVRNDAIAIRAMVYLTLSFDHRILDGAVADRFMSHIKSALENWDEPLL